MGCYNSNIKHIIPTNLYTLQYYPPTQQKKTWCHPPFTSATCNQLFCVYLYLNIYYTWYWLRCQYCSSYHTTYQYTIITSLPLPSCLLSSHTFCHHLFYTNHSTPTWMVVVIVKLREEGVRAPIRSYPFFQQPPHIKTKIKMTADAIFTSFLRFHVY